MQNVKTKGVKMDNKILHKISYGMFVITSKLGDKINGQIANTCFQVSSEPPLIAIALNKNNLTHKFVDEGNVFAVSILSEEATFKFIGIFGFRTGKDFNKFEGINYKIGLTGSPIVLDYALGYIETKVVKKLDVGTHTIFVGEVLEGEILNDKKPMTYDFYHNVIKGKSPKTAPTYIKETH